MPTAVLHSRDDDGRPVVGVPLTNRPGSHAWLYATDYAAILNDYGDRPWFVNDNGKGGLYVRFRGTDCANLVMVARLVVGDPRARMVRYRDGNSLNLRSRNLEAHKARAVPHPRGRSQAQANTHA